MQRPLLFDAVLFDLDGTLVATDKFWVQAARTGARRAFDELGLEREMPSRAEWLGLVGNALEDGFEELFGDLGEVAWRRIMACCVEEEHALLRAGGAALMPGADHTLGELSAQGKRLGIASNCSQSYLDHMTGEFDLMRSCDAAYCLDTPGIRNKADMLERLLEDFGTRSAIMVGDRTGDRNAAWANGLPHVHCAFGFAGGDEPIECEAVIEDTRELLEVLDRRGAWIEHALERIGVLQDDPATVGPCVVGITGGLVSGRSLFARDAARLLRARGGSAVAVSMEAFRQPGGKSTTERAGLPEYYDLDRLERELFGPFDRDGGGEALRLGPEGSLEGGAGVNVPRDAVVLLAGPFLLDPRLQSRLDRTIWLDISEEVLWRRLAGTLGRNAEGGGLAEMRAGVMRDLEAHRERYDPTQLADLVLDASNPLGQPTLAPG